MTINEMRERKEELRYSYETIAELSAISVEIVRDVLEGIIKSPEYEVRKMLEEVLEVPEYYETFPGVKEETLAYLAPKRQGEYTLDDYFALPDEQRVELIDGVIYDMAAPTFGHQFVGDEINAVFRDFIRKKKGKCASVTSPVDVQLDRNNKTMVQPDVLILCEKDKLRNGRVFGAPDLVVEVLLPSTRKKDIHIKTRKYRDAGVREYWRVDFRKKRVYVDEFEKGKETVLYTFEQDVPVGIFNYECKVNFKEIDELISAWNA